MIGLAPAAAAASVEALSATGGVALPDDRGCTMTLRRLRRANVRDQSGHKATEFTRWHAQPENDQRRSAHLGTAIVLLWGILLIAAGCGLSDWSLVHFLGPYRHGMRLLHVWGIRAVSLGLVSWGLLTVLFRHRPLVRKLNLSLFSVLVVVPPLAELGLRLSFLVPNAPTRNPALYTNLFWEDDYWKLHLRWRDKWSPDAAGHIHPLLGWSQARITMDNPYGLIEDTRTKLVPDGRKKVLFYGDSFVAGSTDPSHYIPRCIDQRLRSADVLHLGVGGYGTDQIFLLFRETWHKAGERPFIIMSAMTEDLDRAVLSVRTARKPRVEVDASGELQAIDVPIPTDQADFCEHAPLDLRSFVLRFIRNTILPPVSTGYDPKVEEKKKTNREILDAFDAIVKRERLDVLYVIFIPIGTVEHEDWRERFLKEELGKRSIAFVDSRVWIRTYCEENQVPIEALYDEGGHHNTLGNTVIADGILRRLNELGVE